jgi:outer membrane protein OmpA-like peptidoglycan-associated protein
LIKDAMSRRESSREAGRALWPGARNRARWRGPLFALAVVVGLPLAGCSSLNPANWFADKKNDPGPDARNTQNLEAGSQRDFPSLGTVPPPPTAALSAEERDALTQRLVADRANAKYVDEQLRIGPSATAAPPPPAAVAASAAAGSATSAAATPASGARAARPAAASSSVPIAASAQPTPPAVASPEAAADEQPKESTLKPPEIANLPEPGVPRPVPPPAPADLTSAAPSPPAAAPSPPPLPPAPAPIVAASPRAPPAAAAALPAQVASRPPDAGLPAAAPGAAVAQITFADNSARLSADDERLLGGVVPLQQRSGGAVRVVGYAAKPRADGASQQLASFRMAIERANAVASALAQAGIAPSQISVEAAPPSGTGPAAQRAEVFLEN